MSPAQRVVIRVDSSVSIGTGHVYRCLALAAELSARGANVSFICRDLPGNLNANIVQEGFRLVELPSPENLSDSNAWLGGVAIEADIHDTAEAISGPVDWLIVDHYGIDARWESRFRDRVNKIAVIDDTANRTHACDVLIDQNFSAEAASRYQGLVSDECSLALGPRYALLREAFARARRFAGPREGVIRRVLVFFGGTDASNHTSVAARALRPFLGRGGLVDVVLGRNYAFQQELRVEFGSEANLRFHTSNSDMPELMRKADLAIGAGGTQTWERCCMYLPSLVVSVAANQEQACHALAERGCILFLGRDSEVGWQKIETVISALEQVPSWVRMLSRAAGDLVDGAGCSRVADLLFVAETGMAGGTERNARTVAK